MTNLCRVNINDEQWFVPCDKLDYLVLNDKLLVGTHSTGIALYKNLSTNSNTTNYPYISCPFGSVCYRVNSNTYNYNYSYLTSVSKFEVVNSNYILRSNLYIMIFVIILGVIAIWKLFNN